MKQVCSHIKLILIYLSVLAGLVSCSPTKILSFEILDPAKTDLPDPHGSFLVLNSSYLPENISDRTNLISGLTAEEQIIVDTAINRQIFDGLFSILNDSPIEGLRIANYLELRTSDTTGFLKPLSPVAISDICKENNVDFIISFEYYSLFENFAYYVNEYEQYEVVLELMRKLLWRIYSRDGQVKDSYFSKDSLYWNSIGGNLDIVKGSLSNKLEHYREAFWYAGVDYGKRISPSWESVSRSIYDIKQKSDTGRINVSDNKVILESLTTLKNKSKAFYACYNLAVISESEGDIINALKWIDQALDIRKRILASDYRKKLEIRKNNLEMVDKQTGIKNIK